MSQNLYEMYQDYMTLLLYKKTFTLTIKRQEELHEIVKEHGEEYTQSNEFRGAVSHILSSLFPLFMEGHLIQDENQRFFEITNKYLIVALINNDKQIAGKEYELITGFFEEFTPFLQDEVVPHLETKLSNLKPKIEKADSKGVKDMLLLFSQDIEVGLKLQRLANTKEHLAEIRKLFKNIKKEREAKNGEEGKENIGVYLSQIISYTPHMEAMTKANNLFIHSMALFFLMRFEKDPYLETELNTEAAMGCIKDLDDITPHLDVGSIISEERLRQFNSFPKAYKKVLQVLTRETKLLDSPIKELKTEHSLIRKQIRRKLKRLKPPKPPKDSQRSHKTEDSSKKKVVDKKLVHSLKEELKKIAKELELAKIAKSRASTFRSDTKSAIRQSPWRKTELKKDIASYDETIQTWKDKITKLETDQKSTEKKLREAR